MSQLVSKVGLNQVDVFTFTSDKTEQCSREALPAES